MAYYAIIEHMDKPEREKFERQLVGPGARGGRSSGTADLMRLMKAPRR